MPDAIGPAAATTALANPEVPSRATEPVYAKTELEGALRQGEIVAGLTEYMYLPEQKQAQPIPHALAIVISQDCDLDQEWRQKPEDRTFAASKFPRVLLCELRESSSLKPGTVDKRQSDRIKINKDERWHLFEKIPPDADLSGKGLPELVADFKRACPIRSGKWMAA